LIVDNGSKEVKTHHFFAQLRSNAAVRILDHPGPFNFSALNNQAAREAKGTILGLLNNDIEVRDADWLAEMIALASRPRSAVSGASSFIRTGSFGMAASFSDSVGLPAMVIALPPATRPGR
jgi:GT2 family glycosyltransferase